MSEEYVCKLEISIPENEYGCIPKEFQSPQKLFGLQLGERWGKINDHGRTYYSIFSDTDLTKLQVQVRDAKHSTIELLKEIVARNIKRSKKCAPLGCSRTVSLGIYD